MIKSEQPKEKKIGQFSIWHYDINEVKELFVDKATEKKATIYHYIDDKPVHEFILHRYHNKKGFEYKIEDAVAKRREMIKKEIAYIERRHEKLSKLLTESY